MKNILLGIISFSYIFSIQAQTLYGTTNHGGSDGGGTINTFKPATNNLIVAKSFESIINNPVYTNFIQATNGKLYGMTAFGGSNGVGAIFSYDPLSGNFTKLKDFDNINGAVPDGSLIQAGNGKLYGMTAWGGTNDAGVIFSYDILSSTYTKLIDFNNSNGGHPFGSLVQAKDGKLYGMTNRGGSSDAGVIFSFDVSSSTYTKLTDFDYANGGNPFGSLVQAKDGKLYGMTSTGGKNNYGVIFSFNRASKKYTKLKDFDYANGNYPLGSLLEARDGTLYGMTAYGGGNGFGVIFSFNPHTKTCTNLNDFDDTNGKYPSGSLFQASDGKLYGMTAQGGSSNVGVLFSLDLQFNTFKKLKDFDNINGAVPNGSLIQAGNGKLYAMTSQGGRGGIIFSFDPANSTYTVLKDFGINDSGSYVSASLIQAEDGKLYGMTLGGGTSGLGVVFSFDPSSSTYTKLNDFDNSNGSTPFGSLMQATDGKLYGMAALGGSGDYGVIFSFDPLSSVYTKLKDFDFTNGANPVGSLIQASDGKLYGTTEFGGSNGLGVVFAFDPSSSSYTKLVDFDFTNGANPVGSLIQASDGKLYGTTEFGGSSQQGVIFSYDFHTSSFAKAKDFDDASGKEPIGRLLQGQDGKLYGMTFNGGSSDVGVIFSFDISSSSYTKLKDFDGNNGANPLGSLIQASDKKIYGMTEAGGSSALGVIFEFDPLTSTYTKLQDYVGANGAFPYLGSAFVELSEPAPLLVGAKGPLIAVNPNPFRNFLIATIQSQREDKAVLRITNLHGQQLIRQDEKLMPGSNAIQLKGSEKLCGGAYILTIVTSTRIESTKVVKAN